MMEYSYNLLGEIFNLIKLSQKTIELRILKEKSKNIKAGDYINFNNLDTNEKVKVRVVKSAIYDNIDYLLANNDIEKILPGKLIQDIKDFLGDIYGKNIINSKIVAIEFILIN